MIVLGGALAGAIFGASIAARRGGAKLDIAQYAASCAIAAAVAGLLVTVLIHRAAV